MKVKKFSKKYLESQKSNTTQKSKKDRKGLIIVGFIAFLMLFSIIAYAFFNKDSEETQQEKDYLEYKGYKFYNTGNNWRVQINDREWIFEYLPEELKNITIDNINKIESREVYIAYKPADYNKDSDGIQKLKEYFNKIGINAYPACIDEQGCEDLPIKTCEKNTILLITGKENKIRIETCILLESYNKEDMIKIINKYIYAALGL